MTDAKRAFAHCELRTSMWSRDGQRSFLEYRDLGVAKATQERFGAHVARAAMRSTESGGSGRHYHEMAFHFIYVLKGWVKSEFEGLGEIVLREGDSLAYEGQVPQTHIAYSDDFEVLQLTMPADFATVALQED